MPCRDRGPVLQGRGRLGRRHSNPSRRASTTSSSTPSPESTLNTVRPSLGVLELWPHVESQAFTALRPTVAEGCRARRPEARRPVPGFTATNANESLRSALRTPRRLGTSLAHKRLSGPLSGADSVCTACRTPGETTMLHAQPHPPAAYEAVYHHEIETKQPVGTQGRPSRLDDPYWPLRAPSLPCL